MARSCCHRALAPSANASRFARSQVALGNASPGKLYFHGAEHESHCATNQVRHRQTLDHAKPVLRVILGSERYLDSRSLRRAASWIPAPIHSSRLRLLRATEVQLPPEKHSQVQLGNEQKPRTLSPLLPRKY